MPNRSLKCGIDNMENKMNEMKSKVSIFFHLLRYVIIQECLFGLS